VISSLIFIIKINKNTFRLLFLIPFSV